MIRERIRQFRHATVAPSEADLALAREWLPEPHFSLFAAQHPRDIVHSANTARWLLDRDHSDPALVTAALLHDVGKGHQRRGDRAAYVLAKRLRVARLAASPSSRLELRRAIARTLSHSASGAETLRTAGASERTIDLSRRHHEPAGNDHMLALLQQADAAS